MIPMKRTGRDLVLLFLRLVAGGSMFAGHGLSKFRRLLDGGEITFADPIGLGPVLSFYLTVFAEGICTLLICAGLYTRLATIPLIITLLVIIFVIHLQDPFGKIELPLLYLASYVVLLVLGPGRYALDTMRKRMI
jgi:putative oxidoreductase